MEHVEDTEIARPDAVADDADPGTALAPAVGDALAGASRIEGTGPERHPVAVYLARLAPSGRRTQARALETIAELLSDGRVDADGLPWHRLTYAHTQALRTALADRYAPATANRHLAALRGVLKECWRLGLMDAETLARACDLEPVRGTSLPAGRALTAGEWQALFASCATGRAGDARDAALLSVLYAGGLRRSEAAALNVDDVDLTEGRLTVRRGKGAKARLVYVTGGALAALRDWLAIRGPEPGPLLCPVDKAGTVTIHQMSGQAIRQALARRARKAGVADFSPHDCRRSFVGDLLEAGGDLASVQQLCGHSDPGTTARYDRRGEAAKQRTAGLLHVPYVGRTRAATGDGEDE